MNKKLYTLIVIFFLVICQTQAQKYADKSYYLIDSISLEDLSAYDKNLLDSCLKIYHNNSEDTTKLNVLLHIVETSWDLNLWPKYNNIIASYSSKLLSAKPKVNAIKKITFYNAYSYATKAAYYLEIGNNKSILDNLDKALAIYTEIDSKKEISGVYALYSVYYNNKGNVLKSLEYNEKALKISEQINDYAGMSYAYAIMANHSFDLKDFTASEQQFTKAYKYSLLNNDVRFAGINLVDKAKTLFRTQQLDSSLYYTEKGEMLAVSINDSYGILNAKKLKANIFLDQKKYLEAKKLLIEIEGISRKNKSKSLLSLILKDLAFVSLSLNEISEAEAYAKESYQISKEINRIENKMKSSKLLYKVYEKQNKSDLALEMLKEYTILKDSVFNKKNKKSILEHEVKISYEKQKEIDQLKHEKEITIAEAQKQKIRIGMISAAIIASLIALFSILIFNRLKLIRKQKTALDLAYDKLEETKKNELAVSNLKALQSQMNPHFIFNALNSVQDLVLLQDIRSSNKYLGKFSDLIRKILLSSKEQFISLEEEVEILSLYLDLEKLRFGDDFVVDFKCNVSEKKQDEILLPAMFIQPYVENAIKHGLFHKAGIKKLQVLFNIKNNMLECSIQDNGIGQKKAAEFKLKKLHLHTGFSSGAINERIRLLNQTLDKKIEIKTEDLFENEKALGTKVTLLFPL